MNKMLVFVVFCSGVFIKAQTQSIDTVIIKSNPLKDYGVSQKIIGVYQEDLNKNIVNLSEVLRYNTLLFIKENGRGMTSSPSVRGTTATQTMFLWNEIPINSMFLGQGDINTMGVTHFDKIDVKMGAGSLRFGSGAMGATIHLNNELPYDSAFKGSFFSEYATFSTTQKAFKLAYGNSTFSVKNNFSFSRSENDYRVPSERYINRNGRFQHFHYGISLGYRIGKRHEITLHSLLSNGEQFYPIFEDTAIKSKYLTDGFKSQINWIYSGQKVQNTSTVAYLAEEYDYYANIESSSTNGAIGETILFKNMTAYRFPFHTNISFIVEGQYNEARGYQSGIQNPKRVWGNAVLSLLQPFGKGGRIEASVRKNITELQETPWLFSAATRISMRDWWIFNLNISKNFRLPTFNDLYWQPGGNLSLKPESAWQFEAMQTFSLKGIRLDIVPYLSLFKDMIQWQPTSNGYWSPFNVNQVRAYGGEIYISYQTYFNKNTLEAKAMYAFTKSENLKTQKQNMYVPIHKGSFEIAFRNAQWKLYVQSLYNGEVYTTTDEHKKQALKSYVIANVGMGFNIFKSLELGIKSQNIFNQVYYTVSYYPMPLRNYSIYVNAHF